YAAPPATPFRPRHLEARSPQRHAYGGRPFWIGARNTRRHWPEVRRFRVFSFWRFTPRSLRLSFRRRSLPSASSASIRGPVHVSPVALPPPSLAPRRGICSLGFRSSNHLGP